MVAISFELESCELGKRVSTERKNLPQNSIPRQDSLIGKATITDKLIATQRFSYQAVRTAAQLNKSALLGHVVEVV